MADVSLGAAWGSGQQPKASEILGWQAFPCRIHLCVLGDYTCRKCGDDLVLPPHSTRDGSDSPRVT